LKIHVSAVQIRLGPPSKLTSYEGETWPRALKFIAKAQPEAPPFLRKLLVKIFIFLWRPLASFGVLWRDSRLNFFLAPVATSGRTLTAEKVGAVIPQ
jgi:hypothetical protein